MKKLILLASLALILTGCASGETESKTESSESSAETTAASVTNEAEEEVSAEEESAVEESAAEEEKKAEYNSSITYTCENAADDAQLDTIADVLDKRFDSMFSEQEHYIEKDYANKEIKLEFDNTEGMEDFVEISPLENKVEFIKGEEKSGEVVLTNNNIKSCENRQYMDYSDDSTYWVIAMEFDEEGTQIFADATMELSENKNAISIWLDDELLAAPTVIESIMDGKCQISGDYDEERSAELAKKIAMKPLPFDIAVKGSELN